MLQDTHLKNKPHYPVKLKKLKNDTEQDYVKRFEIFVSKTEEVSHAQSTTCRLCECSLIVIFVFHDVFVGVVNTFYVFRYSYISTLVTEKKIVSKQ